MSGHEENTLQDWILSAVILSFTFSLVSLGLYLYEVHDVATTLSFTFGIAALNLFIYGELSRAKVQPQRVKLWKVYVPLICVALFSLLMFIKKFSDQWEPVIISVRTPF